MFFVTAENLLLSSIHQSLLEEVVQMCTIYTTPSVETAFAESSNNQLFNICDRQLSCLTTVIYMEMKINPSISFVLRRLPTPGCLTIKDV
jgi:hypothetical protein